MFFNPTLTAIDSRRGFFDAAFANTIGALCSYVNRVSCGIGNIFSNLKNQRNARSPCLKLTIAWQMKLGAVEFILKPFPPPEIGEIADAVIQRETLDRASELPPIHRDPYDRFISATALMQNTPVVTADKRFHHYGVEVLT